MRGPTKNAHWRDAAGPQAAVTARPSLLKCLQHIFILLVIHILNVSFELLQVITSNMPVFDKNLNLISQTPKILGSIKLLGFFN